MFSVRAKSLLTNIIVLLVTLLALALAAEVIFRANGKYATFNEIYGKKYNSLFANDHKNWYHVYEPHQVTSQTLKEYSYSILANNEGLLDKDFTVEKKPHSIRIMVIGDSFVQGMGAGVDSTCPKQLEGILRKKYGSEREIEVWNCGIGNSDPYFEYVLLANRLMQYQPDYVIEVVDFTDINDITLRGGYKRFNADSTVSYNSPPWFEPIYARSFLFRRILHDVLRYDWLFLRPKQQIEARRNSEQLIELVLNDFQKLCAAQHVPLQLAFLPSRWEMNPQAEYSLDGLIKYCDSAHIPATDIRRCLIAQGFDGDKSQALYWPIDGHFNPQGYLYFAQCLSAPVEAYLDSTLLKAETPR